VLDLFMPGVRGDRLLQTLRNSPRLAYLPVVFVTGDRDAEYLLGDSLEGVCIVPKARVQTELVGAVTRVSTMGPRDFRGGGATPAPPPEAREHVESKSAADRLAAARAALQTEFLTGLAPRLEKLRAYWDEATLGRSEGLERVRSELHALKGESQLLQQDSIADLLESVESTVRALSPGRPIDGNMRAAVRAALDTLERLASSSLVAVSNQAKRSSQELPPTSEATAVPTAGTRSSTVRHKSEKVPSSDSKKASYA